MILAGRVHKKIGFGRGIRAPYFSYVLEGGGRPLLDTKSGNSKRGGFQGVGAVELLGGRGEGRQRTHRAEFRCWGGPRGWRKMDGCTLLGDYVLFGVPKAEFLPHRPSTSKTDRCCIGRPQMNYVFLFENHNLNELAPCGWDPF